jgi:transcriptional regulator with XRE-family HTH domain
MVARRLFARRKELGLNQKDVVERLRRLAGLEVSIGGYSNWERTGTTDLAIIEALAAALECTPAYLAGWSDSPTDWEPSRELADMLKEFATRA